MQDIVDFYNHIINNSQGKAVITGPITANPSLQQSIFTELQTGIPNVQRFHYDGTCITQPLQNNQVIAEAEERNQAHIVQMFKLNESGNVKDEAALHLLNEILGGNSHSHLFMDLREKQKLAYRVGSRYTSDGKSGQLTLDIKTTTNGGQNDNPDNIIKSLEGFKKHINDLIEKPVTEDELEGAKLSIKSKLMFDYEMSANKNSLVSSGFNTAYGAAYIQELLTLLIISAQPIYKKLQTFILIRLRLYLL